ncbi:alpha/beta fold hydrolase [Streptomyces sp. WAC06614]|uniref:alpha/beta fold hydrolase n=1 Tax=Streptomyces sp. WAC06614 TaxID=2487416 RepID=UPI000F7A2A8A|nr:alpha/beta hydrolase [Streptomyces sp. WAC06614]RSS80272.1 alpha/beta hydrolase [Streptomyces sp. WAC06614]
MADFILVAGGWLGGWAWRDVAHELVRRGHRAVPVTLTGLGDRRHLAHPGVGLGTHVADVVQVIDHEEVSDAVLVGHSYGIFPVVGAADRRPGRIGRVVHLDTGVPQDGDTVAGSFMDEARRAAVQEIVAGQGDGWLYPPQPTDRPEWWGSLDGLDEAARARLARLAAAHPYRCFTEPVALTGAVGRLPATAVLCTGSGVSVAGIEAAYAAGDPVLADAADRKVTFFELATGHYPMLSTPGPLAEVLLDAAAGRGHRLGTGH